MSELTVKIVKGAIVITLPIETIPHAALVSFDEVWGFEQHNYRVTDAAVFAKDVLHELRREDEEGTTIVHRMFDKAFTEAVEQGAEGVEDGGDT